MKKGRVMHFVAAALATAMLVLCAHMLKTAVDELSPPTRRPAPATHTPDSTPRPPAEKTDAPGQPSLMKKAEAWIRPAMQIITHHALPLPYPEPPDAEKWQGLPAAERLSDVRKRLLPKLNDELATMQCLLGQPAFVRIFKESRELELWLQGEKAVWRLFRTYPIACFSGMLGPKTQEGDMQAPEGFYSVSQKQLNPASRYHLAFNIGYPNAYDLAHKRTGSLIMVHGDRCSIGCFAMTDPVIEEIYLVVEAALKKAGSVPVHVFPFRMTAERMAQAEAEHAEFWRGLQEGYDVFEKEKRVPRMKVEGGRYRVE
jgi:murein L,D-transpeptidase YafK